MEQDPTHHDAEAGKFYIRKNGEEAYLDYEKEGELLDFHSTYVPPSFRGQGMAGRIVKKALEHAREDGYKVRPSCPYVASYMDRSGEYQDIRVE